MRFRALTTFAIISLLAVAFPTLAGTCAQTSSSLTANGQSAGSSTGVLAEGTEVHLTVDQDFSSKTAQEGDSVDLVLADDLKVGDIVVARAGARAVGEVSNADRREWYYDDEGYELTIRPDYVRVGKYKIYLRGSFGVFSRHKDVRIRKGQILTVHVSADISLPPA